MAALTRALLDTQFKTTDADQSRRELTLYPLHPTSKHIQLHPSGTLPEPLIIHLTTV